MELEMLSYFGIKRNPIVLVVSGIAVIAIGIIKGIVLVIALGVAVIAYGGIRLLVGTR
jgi:hypothetical protein